MAAYYLEKQVDDQTLRAAAYYGQTRGTDAAIAEGQGTAPLLRADLDPQLADALGLKPGQRIDTESLKNLLTGLRADGSALPVQEQNRDVRSYGKDGDDGKVRHRVAYLDLTLSAPKSVSVAWAFAETEAERNSILQAHRTARDETLRYIEQQILRGRMGKGGQDGTEPARAAWISVDHFTARPTQEVARVDPETGETYTALESRNIVGDPQLHSHNLIANMVRTQSGRYVAIDAAAFHGRIKEFGAIYQALLARELRTMGAEVELDGQTNMAKLSAIPDHVVAEFSKRSQDGEKAARALAAQQGRAWDEISPEQKARLNRLGAHSTRRDKETNTPDMEAWRAQAARIGWEHRTVITRPAGPDPRTRAERMAAADREALPHLAEMLSRQAVLGQGDVRLAAARGFIATGLESTDDIGAMMKHWAGAGVVQDGKETKLLWQEVERGKVRLTTELHRDQEAELIGLARSAIADRRLALSQEEVAAGITRSGVRFNGQHGEAQRKAVETLGTDGGLAVMIGAAGVGKTKAVLPPLVEAWQQRGLEIWGVAQAWRQAKELEEAGIGRFHTRALQPFLDGVHEGRTTLGPESVVVLDELGQIGTRQLLDLLRLRERYGFKLVALGDDKQAQAIEAGPVIDLLRKAIGEERIPQILSTVRQLSEEEREIAGLFREGKTEQAIAAKRANATAELVPGSYRDAVERIADLYAERRQATQDQAGYRITVSAPTNLDAREISRAIRERRREIGEIGPDIVTVAATDGRGNHSQLDLAVGDRVRLFARTRGVFTSENGKRLSAAVGDNGSVLEILDVSPQEGLTVRSNSGKTAFLSWQALRDRSGSGRVLLAHGDVLTIDSSQGLTSDEHINALPARSSSVSGFKAYVAESRHRVRSYLVGSMGAEMREVANRRMSGLPAPTPVEAEREAWANLVRNLDRRPEKESALAFLETAATRQQASVKTFQGVLRRHEARVAEGLDATTVQQTAPVREAQMAMPAIVEAIGEIARQRRPAAQKSPAIHRTRRMAISETEAQQQFAEALRAHGLVLRGLPEMDGRLRYVQAEGNRRGQKSGAYKGFFEEGWAWGSVYNWKQGGFVASWTADARTVPLSEAEQRELAERDAVRRLERQRARALREASAADVARRMIAEARPADASHPYLLRKGVDADGLFQDDHGRLIVPLQDIHGEIRNVQTISADGTKRYLAGARKIGTFHLVGELHNGTPLLIAEGLATAKTVHRASGLPVAMALDTSNLKPVALALREQDPNRTLFIAADNDHHLPRRTPPKANAGKEKGEEAGKAAGAMVLLAPELPEQAARDKGTDWNDYEAARGQDAARRLIIAKMGEGQMQRAAMPQGPSQTM